MEGVWWCIYRVLDGGLMYMFVVYTLYILHFIRVQVMSDERRRWMVRLTTHTLHYNFSRLHVMVLLSDVDT